MFEIVNRHTHARTHGIWPKFERIQALMYVLLVTCKYEMDRIKKQPRKHGDNSNSSKILCMSSLPTNLKWILSIATEKKWQHRFLRRPRAANSRQSWDLAEIIQALIHVLITCKYQKDRTLNSQDKVATPAFPL